MLATDGGIEVVGEAENGAQAVAVAREVQPDVVVLDLVMPVMEGREALWLILRDVSPPPGIVILTMHDQPHLRRELMKKGASAFLAKSASLAEVIGAVKGSRPMRTPREGGSGEAPPAT
jgi:DNA-binding NarL/FixJ family response regulator